MHESSNSRLFKSFENERSNTGKLSESVSFLWTGVAGTKANSGAASERTTDGGRRPESWLEGDRKKEVETNEIFKVAMWCFFFGGEIFVYVCLLFQSVPMLLTAVDLIRFVPFLILFQCACPKNSESVACYVLRLKI